MGRAQEFVPTSGGEGRVESPRHILKGSGFLCGHDPWKDKSMARATTMTASCIGAFPRDEFCEDCLKVMEGTKEGRRVLQQVKQRILTET